jgi:hypothetical protein
VNKCFVHLNWFLLDAALGAPPLPVSISSSLDEMIAQAAQFNEINNQSLTDLAKRNQSQINIDTQQQPSKQEVEQHPVQTGFDEHHHDPYFFIYFSICNLPIKNESLMLLSTSDSIFISRVSVEEWAELCEISRLILSMFACNATTSLHSCFIYKQKLRLYLCSHLRINIMLIHCILITYHIDYF